LDKPPAVQARAQFLVDKVVDIGTFLITAVLEQGSDGMSDNLQKGLNALRCAFLNGFGNSAYLLAAVIYAAAQFEQLQTLQDYANEYYPYLCTCEKDKESMEEALFQMSKFQGGEKKSNFASCAEQDYSEDDTSASSSS
jgi:hypothetical protein